MCVAFLGRLFLTVTSIRHSEQGRVYHRRESEEYKKGNRIYYELCFNVVFSRGYAACSVRRQTERRKILLVRHRRDVPYFTFLKYSSRNDMGQDVIDATSVNVSPVMALTVWVPSLITRKRVERFESITACPLLTTTSLVVIGAGLMHVERDLYREEIGVV